MYTNLLVDSLPSKTIHGLEINTDFRVSILFELLMQDSNLSKREKISRALDLYYENIQIENIEIAIEDMLCFYAMKTSFAQIDSMKKSKSGDKKIYDFEYDDKYIYHAILVDAGVDLQDVKYMHWWKFKTLFDNLSENTQFVKIMMYRAIDLSKIKDKDTKEHYKKLKKLYALPDLRTEEQKQADFNRAFL